MRLIWLEEAERDLDRIVEDIAEDDPATLSVLSTLLPEPHEQRRGRSESCPKHADQSNLCQVLLEDSCTKPL